MGCRIAVALKRDNGEQEWQPYAVYNLNETDEKEDYEDEWENNETKLGRYGQRWMFVHVSF